MAQPGKNLPAMQETQVQSLGQEGPLKKEMATYSSVFAWENPMDRGAWRATVHRVVRVGHDLATKPPPPPGLSFIHTLPASRKVPAPSWYFRTILLLPLLPLSPSFSWRNSLEQQFQAVLSKCLGVVFRKQSNSKLLRFRAASPMLTIDVTSDFVESISEGSSYCLPTLI